MTSCPDVKELLDHESLETLKHYARLTIDDLNATHRKCHPREKEARELKVEAGTGLKDHGAIQ
jgi:hypothetical protein